LKIHSSKHFSFYVGIAVVNVVRFNFIDSTIVGFPVKIVYFKSVFVKDISLTVIWIVISSHFRISFLMHSALAGACKYSIRRIGKFHKKGMV